MLSAMLLLAGCDSWPKTWSRDDIEEIARGSAEDVADDVISSRTSELEARIQDLESEVTQLKSENAELRSYIANDR
jgi:outer membrane murein-binding lipoprotein Lpp